MELTGEMLQKIFVGPKIIYFETINVKSIVEKTFHVKILNLGKK